AVTDYILTLRCGNRSGIVAAVAARIASHGGDIFEAHQFDDPATGMFFMRVAFTMATPEDDFRAGIAEEVTNLKLDFSLRLIGHKRKVLFLVSRFDHCLGDLLYRMRIGELDIEAVGIVSNHPREALNLTLMEGIPYHYRPVTKDTKAEQEAWVRSIIEETGAELVV